MDIVFILELEMRVLVREVGEIVDVMEKEEGDI